MKQIADETQDQFRKKCLYEAGIAYSAAAVLPLLVSLLTGLIALAAAGEGYGETQWFRYLSFLLPQICLAAAAFIYFKRTKEPLRATYCGCKWYYFPVALALAFGLLFSLSELNGYFIGFLEKFGYTETEVRVPDLSGWRLLPAILVIAVLPAVFEETLFRGILTRNMHAGGWGLAAAVAVSGAMFSLFHGNPSQTLYQFVCGTCYALVAVRSGSVFPTVAAHFFNNAAVLVLEATGYGTSWTMAQGAYIAVCAVSGLCLLGTLMFLVFFDRRGARRGGVKNGKAFFFASCVGILVCAVQWIFVLVTGFLHG